MLFEMLRGEVVADGWKSESVKRALDLCLSCKGCKADCPVNVDRAIYKAEFLSHYYEHRLRPRAAYSMGLIHRWARVASRMPRLANFFTQAPLLAPLARWIAGVSQHRKLPPFATQTFKHWFFKHGVCNPHAPRVLLWPDTFNNFLHPHIARAAVEVLEDAGMQVIVPRQSLCCRRPLYDYGMLKQAKKLLEEILQALQPEIASGTPLVGIEPSFGFEADKYDVSVKCGERALLPAVRAASEDTLIVADGFSCMEQINQLTGRKAIHVAQVIQTALGSGTRSRSSGKLEPFVKAEERTPPGVKLKDIPRGGQPGGNGEVETRPRGRSRAAQVLGAVWRRGYQNVMEKHPWRK